MIKKKSYQKPALEVIGFESEDIITTSGVIIDPNPGVGDTDVDFDDWGLF